MTTAPLGIFSFTNLFDFFVVVVFILEVQTYIFLITFAKKIFIPSLTFTEPLILGISPYRDVSEV